MEYIQNRNGQFVVGNEKIRLKGFGIGSWLNLEHYMVGLPTPDSLKMAHLMGKEPTKLRMDGFMKVIL